MLYSNKITFLHFFFSIAFICTSIFFSAGGHGTYIPFAILFGPFSILFFLIPVFFVTIMNGEGGDSLLFFIVILFSLSMLQPVIYNLLWRNFYIKKCIKKCPKILLIIHIIGAIIGLIFCINEEFGKVSFSFIAEGVIVAIVIIIFYWSIFFITLRGKGIRSL